MKARALRRAILVLVFVVSPIAWCGGHMYFEGRRNADALCELARPGMPIDAVIAEATTRRIDFLDDRRLRNEPQAADGELISLTSPFTLRRTCSVTFKDNVVRAVSNEAGPN